MNEVTTMSLGQIKASTDPAELVEERRKQKAMQQYFSEQKGHREKELDHNINAFFCERRIGQLEAEREKADGDPRCANLAQGNIAAEFGVSRREYQRWQARYQSVDDEMFSTLVERAREKQKPLTGAALDRFVTVEKWEPGFKLQTTNQWRFSESPLDSNQFDGGISKHVIANLLHYFTEAGDTVIDPMAGSGRTADVVATMPYFQDEWESTEAHDNGGYRHALLSDLNPRKTGIVQADAREHIPFDNADFVLLDPPYWKIAEDKYDISGNDLGEWLCGIEAIGINCLAALKPGARLALIMDDYLRSQEKQPLALLCAMRMVSAGFVPEMTIYNSYHNASATMGPIQQWRAKKARLMVSGMKVINIFSKPRLKDPEAS